MKNLLRKYKRNEGLNYHSENLLLLAKAFGTEEEIAEAERQAKSRASCDAPHYDAPEWVRASINGYYKLLVKGAAQ